MTSRTTTSPEETSAFGRELAATLHRGDVVALVGDLGSGKTQFVKGVCSVFDVRTPVTSPTFVLLNRYDARDATYREFQIYHLDLYRVRGLNEIYDLGYEEIVNGDGICLVEWAEVLDGLLPPRRTEVRFRHGERETLRHIDIERFPPEDR